MSSATSRHGQEPGVCEKEPTSLRSPRVVLWQQHGSAALRRVRLGSGGASGLGPHRPRPGLGRASRLPHLRQAPGVTDRPGPRPGLEWTQCAGAFLIHSGSLPFHTSNNFQSEQIPRGRHTSPASPGVRGPRALPEPDPRASGVILPKLLTLNFLL